MKFKLDYKWLALSVTNVGLFMACLDSSIVIIGLPTILDQLHASIFHGIWIITGYSLMMTILPVMLGRLADLYGRVRLFNLGFVIFTIGSLLCALSQNGEQLVIFRLLQGSGSALLIVNCIPIITDAFPKEELGMGLGTNIMAANLGNIAGYTLSGVMIGFFGWRSIFLLNVPIGIAGSIFGYFSLREISIKPVGEKFDYSGAILYCVGLLTILIGLTIGNPASVRNIIIMASGIIIFAIAIFVAFRQEHPTLDVKLFKIRAFAAGTMASFLNSIAFACGPFLRSLYLQLVLGYSSDENRPALNPDGNLNLYPQPHQRAAFGPHRQPGFNLFRAGSECIRAVLVLHAQSAFFLQRHPGQPGAVRHRDIAVRFAQRQFHHGFGAAGAKGYRQRHQHDPQPDRQRAQCAVLPAVNDAGHAVCPAFPDCRQHPAYQRRRNCRNSWPPSIMPVLSSALSCCAPSSRPRCAARRPKITGKNPTSQL